MSYFNPSSYRVRRRQVIDRQIEELQKERREIDVELGTSGLPYSSVGRTPDLADVLKAQAELEIPPLICRPADQPTWDSHYVYCVNQKGERTAVWVTADRSKIPVPTQPSKSSTLTKKTAPESDSRKPQHPLLWITTLLIGLLFVTCQIYQPPNSQPNSKQATPTQAN